MFRETVIGTISAFGLFISMAVFILSGIIFRLSNKEGKVAGFAGNLAIISASAGIIFSIAGKLA